MNLFTVEMRERVHHFTVNNFDGIITNILAYISIVSISKKALYNKEVMGRCKKNFLRVTVPSQ